MTTKPSSGGNQPDRFSVSINGFNLFQNIPPLEIRRNTFLVGPNGSGKSTFLRLLPLFALPEKVHLPSLADRGFSIGHFLDHAPAVTTDVIDQTHNADRFWDASMPMVTVAVEYALTKHHWVPPPRVLTIALKEYQETYQSDDSDPAADLLAVIESHETGESVVADKQAVRLIRVAAEYARADQWLIRFGISVQMIVDGQWTDVYSYNSQMLSARDLGWFNAFQNLDKLLDSELDKRGVMGPLVDAEGMVIQSDNVNVYLSFAETPLEQAIHDALSYRVIGDPHGPFSEVPLEDWITSFFMDPLARFFVETAVEDLSRVDHGPILGFEPEDMGRLVSQTAENHVRSNLLSYWLGVTGIGKQLRVDNLQSDGWRLQVTREGEWTTIQNLGGGLARFLWILFVLSRHRRPSVPEPIVKLCGLSHDPMQVGSEWPSLAPVQREVKQRSTIMPLRTTGLLAIEEPENRLHPRLQTYLADILLNVWDGHEQFAKQIVAEIQELVAEIDPSWTEREIDRAWLAAQWSELEEKLSLPYCGEDYLVNAVIVETHSEYLIRRLQSLVARRQVDPSDVIIHYFSDPHTERAEDTETSWPIEINPDGTLTRDFGPGFLGEAASLIDDLWQAWKPES